MRYFRITLNALDPFVLAGPGGNSVLLRLPFYLTAQMFYATFVDGGYVRVPDNEMGIVGPIFDTLNLGDLPMQPYRMFQDSVLPEGAVEADVPLWSANAVALVLPPAEMPPALAWPALNVVSPPDP
jgi:hypothetical protein